MYLEFKPVDFARAYPQYWRGFPPEMRADLLGDEDYIIRIKFTKDGGAMVEVGYTSDVWAIS